MSTVHEPIEVLTSSIADLTTVVEQLERLSLELRSAHRWRIPEVSAACDALECAAVLLRTQQDNSGTHPAHHNLLHDAIALARSTVESTKWAAREHAGSRRPDLTDRN